MIQSIGSVTGTRPVGCQIASLNPLSHISGATLPGRALSSAVMMPVMALSC